MPQVDQSRWWIVQWVMCVVYVWYGTMWAAGKEAWQCDGGGAGLMEQDAQLFVI